MVRPKTILLWASASLLLLASAWSLNIATYNWFAADLHNEYSRAYASRGNIFFISATVLFAAFILVVVVIIRSRKKRPLERLEY
jgi:hypothetical protein